MHSTLHLLEETFKTTHRGISNNPQRNVMTDYLVCSHVGFLPARCYSSHFRGRVKCSVSLSSLRLSEANPPI